MISLKKSTVAVLLVQMTIASAISAQSEFLIRLKHPATLESLIVTQKNHANNNYEQRDISMSESNYFNDLHDLITTNNINITHRYSFGGFEAFSASLDQELMERFKGNPYIAEVVSNEMFQAFDVNDLHSNNDYVVDYDYNYYLEHQLEQENGAEEEVEGNKETEEESESESEGEGEGEENVSRYATQLNAPRHLVRASRRSHMLSVPTDREDDIAEGIDLNYYYDLSNQGESVNAYILDTGIECSNSDFRNRCRHGIDLVNEGFSDLNGHGTHVAGIVGSHTFGVAKQVELVAVKCLNARGQGDLTGVISAIEFALEDMERTGKPGVANLSLGSYKNTILNEAVRAAVESGLVMVVAAGNSNSNACLNSPLSEESAITVGAMDDKSDSIARFSNWGDCVDIFASGVGVESLLFSNENATIKFSGTSMATPSVTGMVSLLLDMGYPSKFVKEKLLELSTKNFMKRRHLLLKPRTPNKLLFNGVEKSDDILQKIINKEEDNDTLLSSNREQNDLDLRNGNTVVEEEGEGEGEEEEEESTTVGSNVSPDHHISEKRNINWYEPSFEELQSSIV